jgi:hypothetical protein
MRQPWDNVKSGNVFGSCDAMRDQVFSHGKVRELQNVFAFDVDNGDQRGTNCQHKLFWILGAPTSVESGDRSHIGLDCEKLGKLLDAKWALGYDEALE